MQALQSWLIPRKGFSGVRISLASSETILERSYGEVLKPETINYRSFRPERDGLFCEKIFGPIRDWECACGKYKRVRYRGIVCDRCGVEVTQRSVRRERFGHIHLAVPVVHTWFMRYTPNKIALVLGMPSRDVERIAYYESYVVIQPGSKENEGLRTGDLLSEEEYLQILESLPERERQHPEEPEHFLAMTGAEALRELLRRLDVEQEYWALRKRLAEEPISKQEREDILRRLRVLDWFLPREGHKPNKPEWMILEVIPVIPPDMRPLVTLEGGRFASSDLNELYRRIIIRNNRLKKLIAIRAPEVIMRNEKRMLQEAVDALFDNSRRVVRSAGQRPLKSLAESLRGKQGRFRQNLLGKRVDYSGRSVIVVGPELKLHECGLPKDMAIELYKPFVIRKLVERGYARTAKRAKLLVERKDEVVWDALEQVIDGHPVLLNRAPTLHRLGIQAFQPRLIEGKAIQLHPLVCTAFNADFDGDQMAVHVPLSYEAQLEALLLMLAPHNIMHTQNGEPIAVPSQDMVLGLYYLTKVRHGAQGEGKVFASPEEVLLAYDSGHVELHAKIRVRIRGELIETTVGRVIFNQIVPPELGFVNELLTKKRLRQLIGEAFRTVGLARTVEFLDALKDMGFHYSTIGGLSVSIGDVIVPKEKEQIIRQTQQEVDRYHEAYMAGILSANERYNKIIDAWTSATNHIADYLYKELEQDQDGFNTFWMMLDSQARGSKEQIRQLGGMRGLMAKPQKTAYGSGAELIENPIISNLREGLSILEYFISTHGARKGLADTALKTADAGYLTRRLHDVAQDVTITMEDCGTIRGIEVREIKESGELEISLYERVLGRVALVDVVHPLTGEVLVRAGELIDEEAARRIEESPIESVMIRSVLTCEAPRGVCAKCYGRNLATGRLVEIGEAVGTVASQSIGEPGTQLTLRTFHTGGAALLAAAQSEITAKFSGIVRLQNLVSALQESDDGMDVEVVLARGATLLIVEPEGNRELVRHELPVGAKLYVRDGQPVQRGERLYEWDPYNSLILARVSGQVRYRDLRPNVTYREQADEQTGHLTKVVIEPRERGLTPRIEILGDDGTVLHTEVIPARAHLMVEDGERVTAGEIVAKIPREIRQLQDITGGLPRVVELFEARHPHNPAVVAEIDGTVSVRLGEGRDQGKRIITITSFDGRTQKEYRVPASRHILVQEGDIVRAGERLTEGAIDPHDILRIKGVQAVQEYLLQEIQQVYRMQGVSIADKHVEIIIRQMLQKVRVVEPGDSMFLEGDYVDRIRFQEENERLKNSVVVTDPGDSKYHVGEVVPRRKFRETVLELQKREKRPPKARDAEPATAEPVLLGITEAALQAESWLAAASFQETTRVLTEAALAAKVDRLQGIKENVILGQLIPAGTGLRHYQDMLVSVEGELPELAQLERASAEPVDAEPVAKGRRKETLTATAAEVGVVAQPSAAKPVDAESANAEPAVKRRRKE